MATSNYSAIIDALAAELRTIPRLTVLDYEPQVISAAPLVCIILKSVTATPMLGSVMQFDYEVACRLYLAYTNNQTAEQDLKSLMPQVYSTLAQSVTLQSSITGGTLTLPQATAGYVTYAGVVYRVVDFTLPLTERVSTTYGV